MYWCICACGYVRMWACTCILVRAYVYTLICYVYHTHIRMYTCYVVSMYTRVYNVHCTCCIKHRQSLSSKMANRDKRCLIQWCMRVCVRVYVCLCFACMWVYMGVCVYGCVHLWVNACACVLLYIRLHSSLTPQNITSKLAIIYSIEYYSIHCILAAIIIR